MARDIIWSALSEPATEHLRLTENAGEIIAVGVVVGVVDRVPFHTHYRIVCDRDWRLREVDISAATDDVEPLAFRIDGEGCWTNEEGEAFDRLNGCSDIDISITPFTNTLPIRRLALQAGASREIDVAFIDLPAMQVKRMRQCYTCAQLDGRGAAGVYEYTNLDNGFHAQLTVDSDGLVLNYPDMFSRVWEQ